MGAVFMGFAICFAVTLAWGIVTVIEEQMQARKRRKAAREAAARWRPCFSAQPAPRVNPTAEDMEVACAFLNSIHRIECSWCGVEMQAGIEPVSHGICPYCSQEYFGVDTRAVQEQGKAVRS